MNKFLKILTMCLAVVIGAALLIGFTGSVSDAYNSTGAPVVIDLGGETGVTLLDQDRNFMTIRMDLGRIEFIPVSTSNGDFILPRVPGFTRSFEVGDPTLPIASKLLSIPFKGKLNVKVLDTETKDISLLDYGLKDPFMPVQPPLSKSADLSKVKFEYNPGSYTGKYSLPLVSTEELGTMRYLRMGSVSISPVEYYPTEKKITVYTSITVRIKYKNPDWQATDEAKRKHKSPYFEALNAQILNADEASLASDLVQYPVKYAIVADRMFESQLQTFITWKRQKGFNVVVGYTDTIGTTTTAIKSWLEGLYNAGTTEDPAPSFVLFVGDAQQIPTWSGTAGSHVTDLYYCEYTDDVYPEVYYGRFSAQNTTQLQPQIDKTLEYEQYTMPDPSYLGDVTLVSGVDSGYADPYGNGQINYGTNYYFNAAHGISPNVWLYPASDGSGVPAAVIATVNAGIGFYNYTAHCSHTGPSDPAFTTTDIDSLTNNHKYLLGIGNCCLSNTFGTDYSTPCFGEKWLQTANKGGIGWIGGTNSTYWDEDYWFGVGSGPIDGDGPTYEETGIGAYDGVFHDHGEPVEEHFVTNGAIIFAGNMAVTEAGSSRITYYWEIYHLMGDPSVMTYMGVPTTNSVSHPSSITPTATSVSVQANEGSYVGISRSGTLHGAGYIGSSGSATIALDAFGTTGTADIVVTCQNKIPYTSTITIAAGNEPPTAQFTAAPTTGFNPLTVNFTDQSTGATSWSWDFGDSGTSTQQNPSHIYTSVGTYTVTLTATNSYGSDTETKTNFITVTTLQAPVANFTASSTTIYEGQSVTFTDTSTNSPTSWSWTFNGGNPSTSTTQNPSVTYSTAGTYTVSLTATNAAGSDTETKTDYITVQVQPLEYCTSQGSNYSYEYIGSVTVGSFTNTSAGSNYTDYTNLTIDLTAGNSTNVELVPVFPSTVYTEYWKIWIDYNKDGDFLDTNEEVFSSSGTSTVTGNFTVPSTASGLTRMRVSMKWNAAQTSCETFSYGEVEDYTVSITGAVVNPPVANFTASATTITAGGSITFTDTSTNSPTSWSWTFNGGTPSSSTVQNPSVTYNTAGTYSVTLTATNSAGSDSETKTNYITVNPVAAPAADFTASATTIYVGGSVTFTDTSTNTPTSWSWSFTGGTPSSSTTQNPTVTYGTAGTYTVSLTATNAGGSDTETKTNYITVEENPLTYCTATSTNQNYEYIKTVVIGSINNTSGASGYTDYTAISTNATRGASVSVSLTPGFTGSSYTEYWKVWVDYNKDGDFADSGEEVFAKSSKSAVTGSFTVPTSAATGSTRMRVIMKYSGYASYCGSFTYGEVEDYTVNIQ